MKLCGCLCLVSAVLCVVVTVTTTVIHMNRLQTLRECVYQAATRTCTCFAGIIDPITQDSEFPHAVSMLRRSVRTLADNFTGSEYKCPHLMGGGGETGLKLN